MNNFYLRIAAPVMVATLCFFTAIAGCQARDAKQQADEATSVQIPESGSPGVVLPASASRTGASGGLTIATLTDASFGGMRASQVTVPGGWRVQGQMITSPCANLPSATWDAVAPNGQSEIHVLPVFGWRWGNVGQRSGGCIPLAGPLHADDFLQKFAARLPGVRVAGTMPIADAFRRREENFTAGANGNNARLLPVLQARNIGDVAAVQAMDASGDEMRLRAWVQCRERSQGGDCADPELRRRVLTILHGASLDEPANAPDSNPSPGRLGPYSLIRLLGAGGIGSVYLAERILGGTPHRVALKVLSPHAAGASFIERFHREQHILASLDHKNITRMLDAGMSDNGQPYLVMEYVQGVHLDQYCDTQRLGIRERIELFLQVCDAVAYAHRNLIVIVHLDLKPSNVLVNEEGTVKLLDFGTSKLIQPESMLTTTVLATPAYASPEQLRNEPVLH